MIVNAEQRRAMEFIATVNRGGYRPTGREINEWRLRPDPKPGRRGKLLEPEVPALAERRVRKGPSAFGSLMDSALTSQFTRNQALITAMKPNLAGLNSSAWIAGLPYEYEIIPGKPGRPAKYGPDKPPEKFLAHLRRLGWVERDNRGRYGVTMLGHALLKAEASADSGDDDSSVMVLAAEDELAYGRVLGVIAECGDAFIIDGYLGAEELAHVLADSNASRFLVNDKMAQGRVTQLAVQIRLAPPNDDGAVRELRRASFHDRFLIGEHKLYGLSSSLNGLGKSMATLVEMPDTAARAIRAEAEDLWDGGEVVAQGLQQDEGDHAGAEGLDDDPKVIRQENGVFQHDGCDVRHRSQQAAERCTNCS